jgi:hypothetical protein
VAALPFTPGDREAVAVELPISDEFDTMDDWVDFRPPLMTVSDGQLHFRNQVAYAPFGYQRTTAVLNELDIVMRVKSENSDWGPDYGHPGGHIGLSLARVESTVAEELYNANSQMPANGLQVYMSFREDGPGPQWWVYRVDNRVYTYHRLGRSLPDLQWHDVLIQVRAASVHIEVDGEDFGTAPFSMPMGLERRVWLGADAGNAHIDYMRVYAHNPVLPVTIDIKPGSFPNSINLGSKGVTPVAVLTTPDFDASAVDPATVVFAGAAAVRNHLEDVDGDNDRDLLLHFDTQSLGLDASSTEAVLTGVTVNGRQIEGSDSVRIVPPGKPTK